MDPYSLREPKLVGGSDGMAAKVNYAYDATSQAGSRRGSGSSVLQPQGKKIVIRPRSPSVINTNKTINKQAEARLIV